MENNNITELNNKTKKIEELEEAIKKEQRKKKIAIILLIIILLLFSILIVTLYILGYRIGQINVVNQGSNQTLNVIKIDQEALEWGNKEELNIFSNPVFDNQSIIAPLSRNTYEFIVENVNNNPIKYNFGFYDENIKKVNLKYRLKLDNVYVKGNADTWVGIEELNMSDVVLAANSKSVYTLEWNWIEQSNELDTASAGAKYILYIQILAKLYNEV